MTASTPVVCLVGWGAIASAVGRILMERGTGARIAAVVVRNPEALRSPLPRDVRILTDTAALAGTECNLVVEAAGRAAAAQWGAAALGTGLDFVMGSPSALADPEIAARIDTEQRRGGGRLIVPAGSLGGIGAIASASRLPLSDVLHEIAKPPRAWMGTPAETHADLDRLAGPQVVFDGTARDAARLYPANANSVVVTALAGIGLDRTRVRLVADPGLTRNEHRLQAHGDFGHWTMSLANAPLDDNPKSSAMTALNLVRVIENRCVGMIL